MLDYIIDNKYLLSIYRRLSFNLLEFSPLIYIGLNLLESTTTTTTTSLLLILFFSKFINLPFSTSKAIGFLSYSFLVIEFIRRKPSYFSKSGGRRLKLRRVVFLKAGFTKP